MKGIDQIEAALSDPVEQLPARQAAESTSGTTSRINSAASGAKRLAAQPGTATPYTDFLNHETASKPELSALQRWFASQIEVRRALRLLKRCEARKSMPFPWPRSWQQMVMHLEASIARGFVTQRPPGMGAVGIRMVVSSWKRNSQSD